MGRDEDAERTHKAREQSRVTKWGKMLSVTAWDEGRNASSYGLSSGSSKRLRRRVYKGIPDIWRSAAWWALMERRCGTSEGQRSSQKSASGRKDALGRRDYERRYERLLTVGSPHDVQIDLDVPRTISGHILFHTRYGQGQRSLFHVLHAFSLLCPDCAYCQGMGPIAATLLCYFEPERAYASLCRLHNHYDLHGIFSPGFPGLVETFYVQEQLVKMLMPRVARVLEEQMISTSAYATKWYITLFANTVPFETQLRIWDAVLLQGREVLVCVGIAVVWALREGLESEDASFESILATLSSFMVPEDEDGLMDWVAKLMNRKDVRMKIVEARREWEGYVASGEAMQHLL